MLRLGLIICGLGTFIGTAAWGRAEFHLGGTEGNVWQELVEGGEGEYAAVDAEGNIVGVFPVSSVPLEPVADPLMKDSGKVVMINFADNILRPALIDPAENLSLSIAERGGDINTSIHVAYTKEERKTVEPIVDGNIETATLRPVDVSPRLAGVNIANVKNIVVNLGAELPINRIRFYPRPGFEDNYLAWYEISVADATAPFVDLPGQRRPGKRWYQDISRALGAKNDPAFDILERNLENLDVVVDYRFPTRDIKWVGIRPLDPERTWEIAEFEIYGEGFVTHTEYRTPILDFGRPVSWSKIRWRGAMPEGTQIQLRTRTGNTPQPNRFFSIERTGNFVEVNRRAYDLTFSAGSFNAVSRSIDAENWSSWSPPYDFASGLRDEAVPAAAWTDGTPLMSPGPSRYLQLEIVLTADRDQAPRIGELSLLFGEESAAQDVIAEVWPIETESFAPHTFTYVVRPLLEEDNTGFDRLEIATQTRAEAVRAVLVDGVDVTADFPPEIQDDRIVVGFELLRGVEDSEKRVEVVFDAKVLRFGTEFSGWVYNSAEPTLKQQVKAGNATFRFGGDVLSVNTPMGGELISDLRVMPPTFTPNGDGVNDRVRIAHDVRNLGTLRQLEVQIFDLAGRLVADVAGTGTQSGVFEHQWDGRDAGGEVVAPGIYVYKISLDTDRGSQAASGLVAVAY